VFNSHPNERLVEWKQFRDAIESSATPLEDVAELWSHAPFVSTFLNPHKSNSWPDPWHLILDGRFDDLAIVLGMLYTFQLTQRFMKSTFEIHMSIVDENKSSTYWLVVDSRYVLNYHIKQVVALDAIEGIPVSIIYTTAS